MLPETTLQLFRLYMNTVYDVEILSHMLRDYTMAETFTGLTVREYVEKLEVQERINYLAGNWPKYI